MTELLGETSYDMDKPTKVVRLHPSPAGCKGLRQGFVTKVVENRGETGSYWSESSQVTARQRWGDALSVCKRCG
jgi:hypothetical protein